MPPSMKFVVMGAGGVGGYFGGRLAQAGEEVFLVARGAHLKTASMQRDIMEERRSELEAQSGATVRLGRELSVPTPTHDFLYAALKPLQLRAREAFARTRGV